MTTRNDLTAQRVRELLDYDPETGLLTWRVNRRRIVNLRDVSAGANSQNQRAAHCRSLTGFFGVTFAKKRYQAAICAGGVNKYLGRFDTPEEAHQAYVCAKRQLHAGNTL